MRAKAMSRDNSPLRCFFSTAWSSEMVEDQSSGTLTVNHSAAKSFRQPSMRPCVTAMILLSESRLALGRERPISPAV
jgi:hypothetical protein